MNTYTKTASQMLREALINNCIEICKQMQQPTELYKKKMNRLIRDIGDAAFISPEEMYRRAYNLSVIKLNQLKQLNKLKELNKR